VLLQGLLIETPDHIDMLRDYCVFLYIEIEKEFWLELSKGSTEQKEEKTYPGFREKKGIHEELPTAKFTFEDSLDQVEEVLESISNGESFDMDTTKKAIQSYVASIMRNAKALL
jgi:hypothetical protein